MARVVRIVDGVVESITIVDDAGNPPPHLNGYIQADTTVAVGHLHDGSLFTEPPVISPTLEEQAAKVDLIMAEYSREGSPLKYLNDTIFEQGMSQDPTLTRAQFDAALRNRVKDGIDAWL